MWIDMKSSAVDTVDRPGSICPLVGSANLSFKKNGCERALAFVGFTEEIVPVIGSGPQEYKDESCKWNQQHLAIAAQG